MDPRLVLGLLRRRTWLLGISISTFGFAFQATAIGSGRLVLVEPILVLHVAVRPAACRPAWPPVGSTGPSGGVPVLTVLGVAGFLIVANPTEGDRTEPIMSWAVPLVLLGGLIVVGRLAAPRLPPTGGHSCSVGWPASPSAPPTGC